MAGKVAIIRFPANINTLPASLLRAYWIPPALPWRLFCNVVHKKSFALFSLLLARINKIDLIEQKNIEILLIIYFLFSRFFFCVFRPAGHRRHASPLPQIRSSCVASQAASWADWSPQKQFWTAHRIFALSQLACVRDPCVQIAFGVSEQRRA